MVIGEDVSDEEGVDAGRAARVEFEAVDEDMGSLMAAGPASNLLLTQSSDFRLPDLVCTSASKDKDRDKEEQKQKIENRFRRSHL